ncbi:ATP-binding protein [Pseudotabrizicola algicola]|uniref:ATP-binding protein n=1 Tax=Pseudotabrizicola algicola TaxID=2709381 RepID=A0A6B3RST3_9RHOB|nr:ATP-binding protein [Pseudotabrizicola algicola]NEX46102.1 ATP-binding protein [Pseudotabrizicola algicola]
MPCDMARRRTRIVIPSDPLAVRQALCALFERLLAGAMTADARDTAQIVLAEALNNIVEHAYAQAPGEIEVTIDVSPGGLTCRIMDAGLPLPGGGLPEGEAPALPAEGDLPEGGFGWHLIRALSEDLNYRREGERNFLSFRISAQQYPH